MTTSSRGGSLAARLVILFVIGSALIMAGAGYALYHALRMQLEAQDLAEVTGKTEVIEHVLRDITNAETLNANLSRIRDISVGHPHLSVGAWSQGRWLIPPREELRSVAAGATEAKAPVPYTEVHTGGRTWWLHRVHHRWSRDGGVDVVLAIETTETHKLLREHAAVAVVVALLGTVASALLAWLVVRRGLAPLAQVAARAGQVTAQRLGARLDLQDAPEEVHGLADSINRMLQRLEESFHTLEQFSADIAHELRTPVNNLLLQTQVTLSRPRTTNEYQETLHSNLVELERLQRMISEMLFIARAERGMIHLTKEDIQVDLEVASVVDYFEAAAAEKSQSIEVRGAATFKADRLMMRRALTNLLSNAVRYSPPGAKLAVTIQRQAGGLAVSVSNPGAAMPKAELDRLFSRFARRDESRQRNEEGAGLGLAIVDSIMKLQGGKVQASSDNGVITFNLYFPPA